MIQDSEIPLCKCHGLPMHPRGINAWECVVKKRKRQSTPQYLAKRRERSSRYRAKQKEWEQTPRAKQTRRRFHATHVQLVIAGNSYSIPVSPDRKQELLERLSEFRSQQIADYRKEAESGWID